MDRLATSGERDHPVAQRLSLIPVGETAIGLTDRQTINPHMGLPTGVRRILITHPPARRESSVLITDQERRPVRGDVSRSADRVGRCHPRPLGAGEREGLPNEDLAASRVRRDQRRAVGPQTPRPRVANAETLKVDDDIGRSTINGRWRVPDQNPAVLRVGHQDLAVGRHLDRARPVHLRRAIAGQRRRVIRLTEPDIRIRRASRNRVVEQHTVVEPVSDHQSCAVTRPRGRMVQPRTINGRTHTKRGEREDRASLRAGSIRAGTSGESTVGDRARFALAHDDVSHLTQLHSTASEQISALIDLGDLAVTASTRSCRTDRIGGGRRRSGSRLRWLGRGFRSRFRLGRLGCSRGGSRLRFCLGATTASAECREKQRGRTDREPAADRPGRARGGILSRVRESGHSADNNQSTPMDRAAGRLQPTAPRNRRQPLPWAHVSTQFPGLPSRHQR